MSYPYKIQGEYDPDKPAVYKLVFKNRFYIWKGVKLKSSLDTISKDITRLRLKLVINNEHLMSKVISYIKKGRIASCTVEVICQPDTYSLLVECERVALINSKENENCLNKSFEPYIGEWLSAAIAKENGAAPNKAPGATIDTNPVQSKAVNETLKTGPIESAQDKAKRISSMMAKLRPKE